MSAMFTPQINEVDRKTNQGFAGKSIETAGPLAMAPTTTLLGGSEHDDFSTSNPFAQNTVDYSNYSQSPINTTGGENSYAIAMSSFIGATASDFGSGDVTGSFSSDGGFVSSSGSDSGFSGGGGFAGGGGSFSGGSSGGFTASC